MFNKIFEEIWANKFVFLGTFFLVFTLSYVVLLALDFLPEPPSEETVTAEEVDGTIKSEENAETVSVEETEETDTKVATETSETVTQVNDEANDLVTNSSEDSILPLKIYIKKLDKTLSVANPTSRTIADLDTALLDGVVRHPDSATLDQEGNIFILGHSSYLPHVFNKNFQAFNGIQNLEWGDIIEVSSNDEVYQYRVEKVYRARAQDVTVPIAGTGNKLTLATCNSFGSVDDRYIVEAKRID